MCFARLNVAGRQANCDDSQVKSCVVAVKGDVSFNENENRYLFSVNGKR